KAVWVEGNRRQAVWDGDKHHKDKCRKVKARQEEQVPHHKAPWVVDNHHRVEWDVEGHKLVWDVVQHHQEWVVVKHLPAKVAWVNLLSSKVCHLKVQDAEWQGQDPAHLRMALHD